jgi:Putative beta-barrel porin-2, OmpL-like. bbp2
MAGPLAANPEPASIDAGAIGPVCVTGAVSALGLSQTHPVPADRSEHLDVGNAQLMVQKNDGLVQLYAQAGAYSIPVIGLPYVRAARNTSDLYGPLPLAYVTLAPRTDLSVQLGKLPTLIGPEPTFTFQNMNIQRGLLWSQEPAVSRGVQANYASGPLSLSLSLNDGFYSGHYSWLVAAATWTIGRSDSLTLLAGGSTRTTGVNSAATPVALNNGQIYNLIHTHSAGAWKTTSYIQVINVPASAALGFPSGARSYGGAVLVSYAFTGAFSLAGRAEVVESTGTVASGAPDLLYGPGGGAMSFALTPTYQRRRFFVRAEPSFVKARHIASGRGFGNGDSATQARFIVETGLLF